MERTVKMIKWVVVVRRELGVKKVKWVAVVWKEWCKKSHMKGKGTKITQCQEKSKWTLMVGKECRVKVSQMNVNGTEITQCQIRSWLAYLPPVCPHQVHPRVTVTITVCGKAATPTLTVTVSALAGKRLVKFHSKQGLYPRLDYVDTETRIFLYNNAD